MNIHPLLPYFLDDTKKQHARPGWYAFIPDFFLKVEPINTKNSHQQQNKKPAIRTRRTLRRLGLPLIIAGIFSAGYLGYTHYFKENPNTAYCKQNAQTIDPHLFDITDTPHTDAKVNEDIVGIRSTYSIDHDHPQTTFTTKDQRGVAFTMRTRFIPEPDTPLKTPTASLTKSSIMYKNISKSTDLEYQTYTDYLKEIIYLRTENSPRTFSFEIETTEGLSLDIAGTMIIGKVLTTGETLFILKSPQGLDNHDQRIDYTYILEAQNAPGSPKQYYRLTLEPKRSWQFDCASYPIRIDPPISTVEWDEALIHVGENNTDPIIEKDGDIIDIRPQGWNWGEAEKKEFVVVRIPKLTAEQSYEYKARTIAFSASDLKEFGWDGMYNSLPKNQQHMVTKQAGLVRYGIDYTKIATADQLIQIRDRTKTSPILDAHTKKSEEIIKKKPDPFQSAIPSTTRLGYDSTRFHSPQSPDGIIPKAYATGEGEMSKTIGTGVGRDYTTTASWEAAQQGDLVTLQQIHTGVLYNDSIYEASTTTTFDGSTTDASYYMKLTVAPGERHTGIPGTGVLFDGHDNATCINISDPYTRVEWISAKNCTGSNGRDIFRIQSTNALIEYLLGFSQEDSTNSTVAVDFDDMSGGVGTIRNSIIIDADSRGIYSSGTAAPGETITIQNVTLYNTNGRGVQGLTDNTTNVTNTIAVNSGTQDYDIILGTQTNTISSDTSGSLASRVVTTNCAPGAGSWVIFNNLTSGKENLHLKNCPENDAVGASSTLSFTFDIDGDIRTAPWDIGADQIAIRDEPVAYWRFDEGYGTSANNSTSSDNIGLMSGPTWQDDSQCISGKCLLFDGTNDLVIVTPVSPSLPDDITLSTWFRTSTTHAYQARLIDLGQSSATGGLQLSMAADGTIGIANTGGPTNTVFTTTAKNDGKWHHFAATRSGTTYTVYVDGQSIGSTAGTVLTYAYAIIGRNIGFTQYFSGFLDEPRIYEYALSADQIKAEFAARGSEKGVAAVLGSNTLGKSLSDGLVGYWKLDNSATPSTDSSGNDINGTWNGNVALSTDYKFGGSAFFDGSGDYISMTDTTIHEPKQVSIAVWAKFDVIQDDWIVSKQTSTLSDYNHGYLLRLNTPGDTALCLVGTGSTSVSMTGTTDLNTGQWYHLVCTYDGQTGKLYVNGNLETTTVQAGTVDYTSVNGLVLGNFAGGASGADMGGKLDDFRLYDRALSAAETRTIYAWGPGPLLHYPFDEHTGTTSVNDVSGNSHTGTMSTMGSRAWVPGKFGSALDFDGTDDQIDVASPTSDDLWMGASQDFTVSFWLKGPSNSAGNTLVRKGNSSKYSFDISYDTGDNSLNFARYDGTNNPFASGTTPINNSQWHFITGIKNGSTLSIYIDGKLDGTATDTTGVGLTDPSTNFSVGGRGVNYYKGTIDDIRVYKYARSPGQIIEDMNSGHPLGGSPVGSQVGYWKFDEGYGTTAYDTSPQNNNGTLTGMASPATSTSGWNTSGKLAKAVTFDGTDDYVRRTSPTFIDDSQGSITSWTKLTNTTQGAVLAAVNVDGATDDELYVAFRGDTANKIIQIALVVNGSTTMALDSPDNTIADTNWHHLSITSNSSTIKLYVDGIEKTLTASVGSNSGQWFDDATQANQFTIGVLKRATLVLPLTGLMDEVKIYSAALTQEQINIDYNQGSAIVLGALSTNSGNTAPDNSSAREYCVPGDTTTCNPPVGEWKFDENTGTSTTADTSGNGFTGTLNGGMIEGDWVQGKIGSALDFDGTDDYVSVADTSTLRFDSGSSDFSVFAWIKKDAINTSYQIVDKRDGSGDGWLMYADSSNRLECSIDAIDVTSAAILTDTNWHFVGCTFDRDGNGQAYIDGVVSGTPVAISSEVMATTSVLTIGRQSYNNNRPFDGRIDNVHVYNYLRSPAQIAWEYNRGAPVAWYKLDECTGTTAYNSAPSANGAAAGNNGTITIGATGTYTTPGTCSSGVTTEAWNSGSNGKYNSSLSFDGTNDYVVTTTSTTMNVTRFTLSAWANYDTVPSGTNDWFVMERGTTGADTPNYYLWVDANGTVNATGVSQIVYGFHISGGAFSDHAYPFSPATNTWYHYVVTSNGTTIKLYINGVQVDSESETNTPDTSGSQLLFIGTNRQLGASNFMDGEIDEVKIFNYALTQAQVNQEMNGGAVHFGN